MLTELNIDGLVGPTHHYGGLGVGNVASRRHAHQESQPRAAALQGLAKMWRLVELGVPQAFLLPPPRPNLPWLRTLGFDGPIADQLQAANDAAPTLVSAAYSSAFMWTANAATVSPSSDSHNKLLHLSVANLTSNLHRAQEASERFAQLRDLFANVPNAIVHAALPACTPLRDEGAANHMRLGVRHRDEGLEIFVHGGNCIEARQAYDASRALARRHQLAPDRTFYLTQSPQAIAAGVFHNDVIATSHENLLVYHEDAFADGDTTIGQIEENFRRTFDQPLIVRKVLRSELSLADAVDSYLFNSQIVSIQSSRGDRNGPMVLLAPRQCRDLPAAEKIIHRWIDDPSVPIESVEFVALDQSMANGGGPACVRLRVSLTESQYRQLPTACLLNEESYSKLQNWVERCYPERLTMSDLPRADLAEHVLAAIQAAPF